MTIGSDWIRYFRAVQQQVLEWKRDCSKVAWAELDAAVSRQLPGGHILGGSGRRCGCKTGGKLFSDARG